MSVVDMYATSYVVRLAGGTQPVLGQLRLLLYHIASGACGRWDAAGKRVAKSVAMSHSIWCVWPLGSSRYGPTKSAARPHSIWCVWLVERSWNGANQVCRHIT